MGFDANQNHYKTLFWIIIAIGFLVRVAGAAYGLPQLMDADEQIFVKAAGHMLSEQSLDPRWYGAPASILIDLLALTYALIGFGGILFGTFSSLADFQTLWYNDPNVFYISGRVITAISGTLCIAGTFSLARQFMSLPWALVAAMIVAFSPQMVYFSSVIRMDMFQIFFMLLVTIYSIKLVEHPKSFRLYFALSGIFLGLAVISKYPGVLAVTTILMAALLTDELSNRQKLYGLSLAALASVLTAFIFAPYLFLNVLRVLRSVAFEARSYHLSATSPGFLPGAFKYLQVAIPLCTNVVIALIGYFGLLLIAFRKGKGYIVATLFLSYLLFISALGLWWVRWSLPLVPLLAVAFAYTLQAAYLKLAQQQTGVHRFKSLIPALALLALSPLLISSTNDSWTRYANKHTRIESLSWAYDNIPLHSKVLLESYAPQLPSNDYEVFIAKDGAIVRWKDISKHLRPSGFFGNMSDGLKSLNEAQLRAALKEKGIQYVIISNFYDRLKAEDPVMNQDKIRVYQSISELSVLIKEFRSTRDVPGMPIRVYQVKSKLR